MKKAIVTLAIGARHNGMWQNFARRGWEVYCRSHGYDLYVWDRPLDTSARAAGRSPAWQKCLVLSHPQTASYDRVVWVDSDILINPTAPSIVEGVPEDKIGATDELACPSVAERQRIIASAGLGRALCDPELYHARAGLPGGQKHIVQTGVMVLSPRHHKETFEAVYFEYDGDTADSAHEMRYLSHEIQSRGFHHWIDQRFNALTGWLISADGLRRGGPRPRGELRQILRHLYLSNYFLHFAANLRLMASVDLSPG